MLKNYFKIAWRNLLRNKVYSAINVAGLATGISACILIFFFVKDELTYERHFDNYARIYRVVTDLNMQGQQDKFARSPGPLAAALEDFQPEVQMVARLLPIGKQTIWLEDKAFNEENLFFASNTFFDIFSYEFLQGNPLTALDLPKTAVISNTLAEKYFGSTENAMGQALQFSKNAHIITGVFKKNQQSHINADILLSESTLANLPAIALDHWFSMNWFTYVLVSGPDQEEIIQKRLDNLYTKVIEPWTKENKISAELRFALQPISDIHLKPERTYDISPAGNRSYVYIFGLVAIFILLIACINYMNLATARSAKRAREVGLRKVVGAQRSQLIWQFVGESVLITLLAILLALASVEMMLPFFNTLTGKNFTHAAFLDSGFILTLLGIVLFVGLIAGSYPAFFLSKFKPAEVLKSDKNPRSSNAIFRKALVVVQFTISLILIIGTLVVYRQMQFLKNAPLGFRKEQILVIEVPIGDSLLIGQMSRIKHELLQQPAVEKVSTSAQIPGERTSRAFLQTSENDKIVEKSMAAIFVDHDFVQLMGIKLVKGRDFSKNIPTDLKGAFLINEAAARYMGWKEPLGKKIVIADWDGQVVGVMKDFHYTSLHSNIEPLILALAPTTPAYLLIRLHSDSYGLPRTLDAIASIWKKYDSKHPMEYYFLDDNFAKQYRSEEKMLAVFGYFAGLTILIACLGLFGLTSFTAEQRTKEIGVRKVLGSSVTDIVILLSKDFALLVLIAILLAIPVAWYGMHFWLKTFAYQLPIQWWVFVLAGLLALLVAMLTVSFQATKAAWLNPVKALRAD